MDEMKVKLSSAFMKNMVAKLIAKTIYKKYGYKINIQLEDLGISMIDGETSINTNVNLKLSSDEFMKLMKSINKD